MATTLIIINRHDLTFKNLELMPSKFILYIVNVIIK